MPIYFDNDLVLQLNSNNMWQCHKQRGVSFETISDGINFMHPNHAWLYLLLGRSVSNYINKIVSRQHAAFWNPLIKLYRYLDLRRNLIFSQLTQLHLPPQYEFNAPAWLIQLQRARAVEHILYTIITNFNGPPGQVQIDSVRYDMVREC